MEKKSLLTLIQKWEQDHFVINNTEKQNGANMYLNGLVAIKPLFQKIYISKMNINTDLDRVSKI